MDMLNNTIKCDKCDGTGKKSSPDPESSSGSKVEPCSSCNGAGIMIDNKIGDLIKKFCPDLPRADLPKMMTEIYKHYDLKLKDSYDRGVADGKEADRLVKIK